MILEKLVSKIKLYLNNHPFIASVVVFILIILSFFIIIVVYADGDPVMGDHYFHFEYADLLRTKGLDPVKNFDFIYSIAKDNKEHSRYAVSLFQISLIPFTFFKNKILGLNFADIFQASTFIAIVYYIMHKSKIKYPLIFTLLMFTSSYFVMRLLIGRAFVLAISFIFLEMYFGINKKCKVLFAVTLLHILWHQNTYFMPIAVIGAVEASRYLVTQKMHWKNIVSVVIAIITGMIFFPGFPNSLFSWLFNIFAIQSGNTVGADVQSIGGNELISKDFMRYFANDTILLASFVFDVVGIMYLYILQKQQNIVNDIRKYTIWSYALFLFMIVMMLGSISLSGRFYDFLYPTIFILAGYITTIFIKLKKIDINIVLLKFLKAGFLIVLFIIITNVFIKIYEKSNSFDALPAQKVAQWVANNSQDNDKVFLSNWGLFTIMFFNNHNNKYSMGIEPISLRNQNEEVYWKYYNIFRYNFYCEEQGDCKEELNIKKEQFKNLTKAKQKIAEKENSKKIINFIKNDFQSKFIISSSNSFSKTIKLNPKMIEKTFYVKSDKYKGQFMEFTVFKLK